MACAARPSWLGVGSAALSGTRAPAEGRSARGWCPGNPGTRLRAGSLRPRCALAPPPGSLPARRPAVLRPVGGVDLAAFSVDRVEAPEVERQGAPGAGGGSESGRGREPTGTPETAPCSRELEISRERRLRPDRGGEEIHLAADLGLKSSSSHSDHSSETSLPDVPKQKYPEEFSLLKLQTKDGQRPEWTFYPRFSSNIHTYHVGKQCFFNGVFLGNRRSLSERRVDKCFGRKKYDIDPRNGIPKLTPGDNPYMYPEQSKDFHKAGSTLPPVNFSIVPYEKKYDTFIPLEPLPQIPTLPFWVKEKANKLQNEIREVEELDNWQPASPLMHGLLLPGGLKNLQR
ncbi:hypothetical protein GH733_000401, partial [Mirounga leonina]